MTDTAHRFDSEDNPRSDMRVGRRLGALMGAADDISTHGLEDAIDKFISFETIRRTRKGERGLSQAEAFHISQAIGWALIRDVGDVEEWLLSGKTTPYNPGSPIPR